MSALSAVTLYHDVWLTSSIHCSQPAYEIDKEIDHIASCIGGQKLYQGHLGGNELLVLNGLQFLYCCHGYCMPMERNMLPTARTKAISRPPRWK